MTSRSPNFVLFFILRSAWIWWRHNPKGRGMARTVVAGLPVTLPVAPRIRVLGPLADGLVLSRQVGGRSPTSGEMHTKWTAGRHWIYCCTLLFFFTISLTFSKCLMVAKTVSLARRVFVYFTFYMCILTDCRYIVTDYRRNYFERITCAIISFIGTINMIIKSTTLYIEIYPLKYTCNPGICP